MKINLADNQVFVLNGKIRPNSLDLAYEAPVKLHITNSSIKYFDNHSIIIRHISEFPNIYIYDMNTENPYISIFGPYIYASNEDLLKLINLIA